MKKLILALLLITTAAHSKDMYDYQETKQLDCQTIKIDQTYEKICVYEVYYGSTDGRLIMIIDSKGKKYFVGQ